MCEITDSITHHTAHSHPLPFMLIQLAESAKLKPQKLGVMFGKRYTTRAQRWPMMCQGS